MFMNTCIHSNGSFLESCHVHLFITVRFALVFSSIAHFNVFYDNFWWWTFIFAYSFPMHPFNATLNLSETFWVFPPISTTFCFLISCPLATYVHVWTNDYVTICQRSFKYNVSSRSSILMKHLTNVTFTTYANFVSVYSITSIVCTIDRMESTVCTFERVESKLIMARPLSCLNILI